MIKLIHFADAHIDMVTHGRHDTETGMPIRVVDFLQSLDAIIDRAIAEAADLVIFAGDAYRNQRPHPRFQQQWQQRIVRLSQAGIPIILLIGNHDTSPAARRAHAMQEFATLNVPGVFVADRPRLYTTADIGAPVQVLAIPWLMRNMLLRREEMLALDENDLRDEMETRISSQIERLIAQADPDIPLILTAHATVGGATWGSERQVLLGRDFVLSGSVVADKRFDYVALGHIHQHQDVNKGKQPPVVYAGSIERVDFGEAKEQKGFVLAQVAKGQTDWQFVKLNTRPFVDVSVTLTEADNFMQTIIDQLPAPEKVVGAICRVQLRYPRQLDELLDEGQIGQHFKEAFSLQINRQRGREKRTRLGDDLDVEALTPSELLGRYWQTVGLTPEQSAAMHALARETFKELNF